ncbi:MAG: hypothetical protein WCL07_02615 [bacterium]
MLFDNPNLLSNEEMREELTKLGYSTNIIDSIIEQFWFHDPYNSFISIIPHFEILKQFLEEKKPDTFSRFDFYYFFFKKVVPDYQKLKKPFQQLGLYFEQVQKNQMLLTEFSEVLKKINVPVTLTVEYLEKIKLVSISEEKGIQTVSWAHHTLTEFLAAENIHSQDKPIDELKSLIIDSKTGNNLLKPSWTGALRFLVELDSEEYVSWAVEFLAANQDSIIDQIAEMLIFSTNYSVKPALGNALFLLVFTRYQEKKFWIPVWAYRNFYKFINEAIYKDLKANADDKEYVHKGNIAATIDGMLQKNHPLLTEKEKTFWREKLISYANENNGNEVLNRHSMAALENFKDQTDIILQVKKNSQSTDSLVQEAYISMCRAIDANATDSIEIFIKAITDDKSHIYARNALYSINTQKGIETFFQSISDNSKFIHEFLDNESIFNKKDTQADSALIDNIKKHKNTTIITLLKKLIISAFTGERNYDAGKSWFLQQIALIIQADEPEYLDEFVQTIKDLESEKQKILFINDVEGVLSVLIQPKKLELLCGIFKDQLHHHAGYALAQAVRLAPHTGNPKGDAVLKKGIKLGITADPNVPRRQKDYQTEQNDKIYKQFQKFLSPGEDKYFHQVFRYYIENKKLLQTKATVAEKERLLKLAVESNLDKIDPINIEMHYNNPETKSGEYTISSVASYFPAVLEVIYELDPVTLQKPKNRKKLFTFVPFSYLSEFKSFKEMLGEVSDEDLIPLNEIMLDKSKDLRYLIPQTYIYLARVLPGLASPKEVLISFIEDPLIAEHDHEYALENLEKYLASSDTEIEVLLKKLWEPKSRSRMSDLANGLLISVFHDEEAINWRFETLKSSATPYRRQEGFHSVGNLEMELDTKSFAKPLINLSDEKYLDRFIELLDFSLTIVEKPDHKEYANYLWSIVIAFVARDEFLLSVEALTVLKSWAEQHLDSPEINWLLKRISELSSQNNLVIKVVEDAKAIAVIERKNIKWTYLLLREKMKLAGSEQNIDIFISHASAGTDAAAGENNFVKKLNKKLQEKGYITFLDEEYPAPAIKDKININLPKSKFMVVVGSMRYRKRICGDGAFDIKKELYHFSEREERTGLPYIFLSTYKITRDDWKVLGVPELQGNRMQEAAEHDADGEVDKVVEALLKWVNDNDPETIKKFKK